MIQVKGSAVTSRIRFVRDRYGEPGYRRLKDELAPEERATLEARILPHQWVPYDLFVRLNVVADRMFGEGDLQLCREMGRFGADLNLPTLYRIFYKLGTPAFILGKAARLWDLHYSSGRLAVHQEGPGQVRLSIHDFARPHRAHCMSVLGWAERSAELSGAALRFSDEVACRTRGAEACELFLEYDS